MNIINHTDEANGPEAADANAEAAGVEVQADGAAVQPPDDPPSPDKAKPGRKKSILTAVAAVALLAGGTAVGTLLPDPKTSEAYVSLAGAKTTVEAERDASKSSYDSLKSRYDTLQNGMAARATGRPPTSARLATGASMRPAATEATSSITISPAAAGPRLPCPAGRTSSPAAAANGRSSSSRFLGCQRALAAHGTTHHTIERHIHVQPEF
jgi:hypothetical protein